jgi:hypothetical protein
MGVPMVDTIEKIGSQKTVSKTKESKELTSQTTKTTSVDSRYIYSDPAYNDPDLLIREYFLSSPAQRVKLRKLIFQNIKSWQSVLVILSWSRKKEISDAYDGASDLLAECTDISLLKDVINYLTATSLLISSSSTNKVSNLDAYWEVLIKGIAYAYGMLAQDRFQLILNLISVGTTRIFKAAIIDALVILADEIELETIKNSLGRFSSPDEPDLYIRDYAEEALQEVS